MRPVAGRSQTLPWLKPESGPAGSLPLLQGTVCFLFGPRYSFRLCRFYASRPRLDGGGRVWRSRVSVENENMVGTKARGGWEVLLSPMHFGPRNSRFFCRRLVGPAPLNWLPFPDFLFDWYRTKCYHINADISSSSLLTWQSRKNQRQHFRMASTPPFKVKMLF